MPSAPEPPPADSRVPDQAVLMALHGHGIRLSLNVPALRPVALRLLESLIEPALPREPEIRGTICAYDESAVLRHVSADAVRLEEVDPLSELYQDPVRRERIWLVDERWGICELNLLRRTFRSWILPAPACDVVRLFESAVYWPLAQLLRGAGLHLIPGAAVGRDGRGVLVLSPFDVGAELDGLARAGVGIIGQRWVALREEADGRIGLLSVPGYSEMAPAPRLLSAGPMGQPCWLNLAAGRTCHQAYCELVLLVEPMRRSKASVVPLSASAAREQLKLTWPVAQLSAGTSATVTTNMLAARLSRQCRVHRVRLSRNAEDLARLLVRPATSAAA